MGFISVMNKTLFLFTSFLLLVSCNQKKPNTNTEATNSFNTISVIIDDQLWNGEVGDSIRNKFASPVLGLQEEEPMFTLNQFPVKLLEGFMTNGRNTIVIKKEAKSKYTIKTNEKNPSQTIVTISGRVVQEIIDTLEIHAPEIIQTIKSFEIKEYQKQIKKANIEANAIKQKFDVEVKIPLKYKIVEKAKNFIWLKKEITTGSLSVLIYQTPLNQLKDTINITQSIIKTRDSIGKKYIHGRKLKTRMITEKSFSPYLSKKSIAQKTAYEIKGTWDLKNDFMSGPFINYAIIDKNRKRVLFLEGFCYAPSKEKRDLMFELEAIIKTVNF